MRVLRRRPGEKFEAVDIPNTLKAFQELALRIGMSESSLRSRLSHPEWFRLVELRKIARVLGQELEVKV